MQPQQTEQSLMTQTKQNSIIRKAAIQSFQPIVTKMEQHISYLLEQTTKLREKNEKFEQAIADHNIINKAVTDLREDVHRINLYLTGSNQKAQSETTKLKTQIINISIEIENINTQLRRKENKIKDLTDEHCKQNAKVEIITNNFKEIVDEYISKVQLVNSDNVRMSNELKSINLKLAQNTQNFEERLRLRDIIIQQSTQKIQHYLQERGEMREMITEMKRKIQNMIDRQKHEQDWKVIRLQHQFMHEKYEMMRRENQEFKRQNLKLIDQALTPEVRKFLPEIMERISQIRKVNILQTQFLEQKNKLQQNQHRNQTQFDRLELELQWSNKKFNEWNDKIQKLKQQLSQQFKQGNNTATQTLNTIQTQTTELVLNKEKEIRTQMSYLIENNKEVIYENVVNLIPQEQKDFFNHMKDFMPILEDTKKQVMERCEKVIDIGKSLQERLDSFNNKIMKIKGDLNIELQVLQKRMKSIENSTYIIYKHFKVIGKIISSFSQLFLILYSFSFQMKNAEVYASYNDGIICQKSLHQDEIFYRKNRMTPEQLKRNTLTALIKFVDGIISHGQFSFLGISQYKPSDMFKTIIENFYQSSSSFRPRSGKKQQQKSTSLSRKKQNSLESKFPLIDYNPSKTIDFSSQPETTRQHNYNTMASRRNERPYRNRYSNMK